MNFIVNYYPFKVELMSLLKSINLMNKLNILILIKVYNHYQINPAADKAQVLN